METRCPYPDCRFVFDSASRQESIVSQASNGFQRAICVACKRRCTLKPVELLEQMEKKEVFLAEQNSLEGGPSVTAEQPARLLAVLEDLRSLQNIGSIFRTADAIGFEKIFLSGICGVPNRKDVTKASLGAEEHISWKYSHASLKTLQALKADGVFLLGLELTQTSVDLERLSDPDFAIKFTMPLCMVLGNEVSGVSEEALSICDLVCHIPMKGTKESLNVAVAFGIAAYEIARICKKLR
jgi:23S rRNA (guanosine2251-2'-O)-methyltransferase